ncbi:MAG: outer membrane beta-barrel protein [Bacteroidetes bacterium]|nr:outer membrane beta-barrel protein [Bacteroidota bacterium]
MRLLLLGFCLFGLGALKLQAQDRGIVISGRIVDAKERTGLPGANVILRALPDTTRMVGVATDAQGNFSLRLPGAGRYRLQVSFVGYRPYQRELTLTANANLGTIPLDPAPLTPGEVTVEAVQERAVVKGDTIQFNAAAFKVSQDATAEDLVKKLPGVTVEGGQVQAQGETVRRVLVDGREFFGQDPMAVLRNLPAEVVQSIQVFDRASDQAQFTGFQDGNTERTINIITRPDRRFGQFGRLYGGYGPDARYASGGTVNVFSGNRRVSLIGLGNNINQQNFAIEDILGALGSGSGGGFARMFGAFGGPGGGFGGGGGRGGPGGGGGGGGMFGGGGGPGGGGPWGDMFRNVGNFLIGEQPGVNTTHSVGINYSDVLQNGKVQLSGSYFFNRLGNQAESQLSRQYFTAETVNWLYDEATRNQSTNYNHRLNLRLEYTLDSRNSFVLTPRISFQDNSTRNTLQGLSVLASGQRLSQTSSAYNSDVFGYNGSIEALYRLRFPVQGRTFSARINAGFSDRSTESDQRSANVFFRPGPLGWIEIDSTFSQRIQDQRPSYSLDLDLSYTEPIGSYGQLQIEYEPTLERRWADKQTRRFDPAAGVFGNPIPTLSSQFDNTILTHQGVLAYQYRRQATRLTLRLTYQNRRMLGDQTYPYPVRVDRAFNVLLPFAELEYRLGPTQNLRFMYRAWSGLPSINQLQPVVDNSNPLFLSSGNPDLEPSYTHMGMIRYQATDPLGGRFLMVALNVNYGLNYITNASLIAQRDTLLPNGVYLPRGTQYSFPTNLDGNRSARLFLVHSRPLGVLRTSLNMLGGLNYNRTPSLISGRKTWSDLYGLNTGLVLTSNISERVDFLVLYNFNYNRVRTSTGASNNTYQQHRASVNVNLQPWGRFVVSSQFSYTQYVGLGAELDEPVLLWNAALGVKFLKDNAGELRIGLSDILNQNKAISRSVTEQYIQDTRTQVLGRYVMFSFSYRLRNFRI